MTNKIDKWKFWLDLNKNTFRAMELTAFFIAILGIRENLSLPNSFMNIIFILIGLSIVMQLILGIRQILLDNKTYKEQQKKGLLKLKRSRKTESSSSKKN